MACIAGRSGNAMLDVIGLCLMLGAATVLVHQEGLRAIARLDGVASAA